MIRRLFFFLGLLVAGCAGHDPAVNPPPTASQVASVVRPANVRVPTKPYLNMPESAAGVMPTLLSQTGAFADVRTLQPAAGLLPYDLVIAFWSDGASKSRFVAIPEGKVAFSPDGEWAFPPGTVFVKTFELPVDASQPQRTRRLETRLLVVDRLGGVYGVTYKWRADVSDADLAPVTGLNEEVAIRDAGGARVQTWYYPSREDCLVCHNSHTKGVLGPKTRQLNRDLRYPDGSVENELRRWNRLGLLEPALDDKDFGSFATLAPAEDASRSIEDRARSWLDANCAHCHRPGATVANFDARFQTPLAAQQLVDGPVLIDQNVDRARVISPHDPWRSVALMRIDTNDDIRMPPLARHVIDAKGVALVREWILSLPGREVVPPPSIQPVGGSFNGTVSVSIASSMPGADIRYTLDGSAPGPNDARYEAPVRIEGPAVLRARAYKEGFTRSVIAQQTYVIER